MTEVQQPPPSASGAAGPPRRRGRRSRWLVLAVAAAVAAVGALALARAGDDGHRPSSEALAVPFTTADGGTATLGDLVGEPLVVNFFASWCPPCRAELPHLEQAHRHLAGQARVVGVNVDFDASTWKSFVAGSGITYQTVFEPRQDLLRAVGGKGMPTTVLISADGRIVHVHTGALDEAALLELVRERLA